METIGELIEDSLGFHPNPSPADGGESRGACSTLVTCALASGASPASRGTPCGRLRRSGSTSCKASYFMQQLMENKVCCLAVICMKNSLSWERVCSCAVVWKRMSVLWTIISQEVNVAFVEENVASMDENVLLWIRKCSVAGSPGSQAGASAERGNVGTCVGVFEGQDRRGICLGLLYSSCGR